MIEPEWCFQIYSAIRLHFTSPSYDAIKYNWKTRNCSREQFLKRKDRSFFVRLSRKFQKKDDFLLFLIANFVYNSKVSWIGDFVDENADDIYKKFIGKQEGLSFAVESDIIKIRDVMLEYELHSPNDILLSIEKDTNFPYIINLALRNDINIETLILMDRVMGFLSAIDKKIGGDNFIWNNFYKKLQKYNRLMTSNKIDNDQVKKMILKTFNKEIKTYEFSRNASEAKTTKRR